MQWTTFSQPVADVPQPAAHQHQQYDGESQTQRQGNDGALRVCPRAGYDNFLTRQEDVFLLSVALWEHLLRGRTRRGSCCAGYFTCACCCCWGRFCGVWFWLKI